MLITRGYATSWKGNRQLFPGGWNFSFHSENQLKWQVLVFLEDGFPPHPWWGFLDRSKPMKWTPDCKMFRLTPISTCEVEALSRKRQLPIWSICWDSSFSAWPWAPHPAAQGASRSELTGPHTSPAPCFSKPLPLATASRGLAAGLHGAGAAPRRPPRARGAQGPDRAALQPLPNTPEEFQIKK